MKVWIVLRGEYEDTHVMGVYSDLLKATAIRDEFAANDKQQVPYGWFVEEHEVQP